MSIPCLNKSLLENKGERKNLVSKLVSLIDGCYCCISPDVDVVMKTLLPKCVISLWSLVRKW